MIIACQTEGDAIVLVRQLQALLHERIEELRGSLTASLSCDDKI